MVHSDDDIPFGDDDMPLPDPDDYGGGPEPVHAGGTEPGQEVIPKDEPMPTKWVDQELQKKIESVSGYKQAPYNVDAERSLLGAIMMNNKAYYDVAEFLRPEHFAISANSKVYEACSVIINRGQIADAISLKNYFATDQELLDVGGTDYLVELTSSVVSVSIARQHGWVIHDNYIRRQLIILGIDMVDHAHEVDMKINGLEQIQQAEQGLFNLATMGDMEGGFVSFQDSLIKAVNQAEAAHKRGGGLAGITSGLRDLDQALGGLHKSDLLILAGRPSMGKTALVTCIAYNAAYAHKMSGGKEGGVVGFFSLEMSAEQLAGRILSQACAINSNAMRKGEMSNDEFERVIVSSQELLDTPLHIDDTPGLSVSALRTRARRLKRQHGLDLIIVDYLQLVSGSPETKNNRVNEISEITRGLKMLAKELDVPVIALSQLSRAVEQREDKRPQLSDLRESGSIEQDADVVMFIYREFYYLDRSEPVKRESETDEKYADRYNRWEQRKDEMENKSEVIVAKQRHGPLANIPLFFKGEFTQFGDLDETHVPDY